MASACWLGPESALLPGRDRLPEGARHVRGTLRVLPAIEASHGMSSGDEPPMLSLQSAVVLRAASVSDSCP
jgi:hypothetical protein